MSDQVKIGKIIDSTHQRDAIHIAIYPVRSKISLKPGECIELDFNEFHTVLPSDKEHATGIVDPFLEKNVEPEEWFYMFLMPNTVTDMRHHWEHPAIAFEEEQQEQYQDHADVVDRIKRKGASEKWLMEYAVKHNPYLAPDVAYQHLLGGLKENEVWFQGRDLHSFSDLPDADELAQHAKVVIGIDVNWDNFTFTCGC